MFEKVLIANRGEIALRILRACREMGISTVAVHSTADTDAMHVRFADESVCIGPPSAKDSYLSIQAVLSAAAISGADAIHPGYGFLSENADFAQMVAEHGFTFIGPSADHIRLMGDKVQAKAAAKAAGIPVVPGSDGAIEDIRDVALVAKDIGYPVLIKAAAGGGLDQHGIADVLGDQGHVPDVLDGAVRSGHHGDTGGLGGGLGLNLVAHQPDVVGRRTDEGEAVFGDHLGEIGVFRQEAVTGMDGVGPGNGGGRQHGLDRQVAVLGRRRADAHAFVGEAYVHGVGVGGGMDGDRGNAHFAAGAQDAQRDFPPVGDQDLFKQGLPPIRESGGVRRTRRGCRWSPGPASPCPRAAR